MVDSGCLAVHDFRSPDHLAAPCRTDGLVTEADAQYGDSAGGPADDRRGHAGVLGTTGSRADEHCVGLQGLDLVDGDCIVAVDLRVGT